jgi:outer membrane lipoprotein-sorting protein
MTMKKLFISLFILLFITNAFCQTEKDKKAEKILNALSEKAKTYKTIEAAFIFTQTDLKAGEETIQEGQVKAEGEKFALVLGDYQIYNDGNITWTFDADMNEATKDLTEDVRDPDSPTFNEMLTMWESGFKYKFDSEKTVNGKTYQVIDLYPENTEEKTYHTAKLTIDKAKQEIVKIILLGKDGINYAYEIKSFKVNTDIPENTFTFDPSKHPDCEVIDNIM